MWKKARSNFCTLYHKPQNCIVFEGMANQDDMAQGKDEHTSHELLYMVGHTEQLEHTHPVAIKMSQAHNYVF